MTDADHHVTGHQDAGHQDAGHQDAGHQEVEVKLDAPATFVRPDLVGSAGIVTVGPTAAHGLVATYFDTTDLRLARAGVTLRRRTGGPDAGWHLKRPSREDALARIEVHRPLGRATRTPPRSLVDLVRVLVRDRGLVAVATVSTQRLATPLVDAAGSVLAELADDRVEAVRLGERGPAASAAAWREIEVELVDGDRAVLVAVVDRLQLAGAAPAGSTSKLARALALDLRDAGLIAPVDLGPKSEAGAIVQRHLAEQVAALVRWDPLARLDSPDAVHKLRVAARRLRSALSTFGSLLDRSVTDPIRIELRWLGQQLGGPRDEEVMQARLVELVAAEPRDLVLGPVRRRIDAEIRARHRVAFRALVTELSGSRYFRLLDALDDLAADPPLRHRAAKRARDVLPGLVARSRRRVLDAAAAAEAAATPADRDVALHEVRKAAKRARYAGEAVAPALGARAARFASTMERLQEVLGEQRDTVVTRAVLRELGVQAHLAGENGFTFGRLHGLEAGRSDVAVAEYAAALAAVAGKPPAWLR